MVARETKKVRIVIAHRIVSVQASWFDCVGCMDHLSTVILSSVASMKTDNCE